MKKRLILLVLALACTGCSNKDGGAENVAVSPPGENVYDVEESAVIASEKPLIEEDGEDIAVGTDTEQNSVEQNFIEEETAFTEEMSVEEPVAKETEENVESTTAPDEDKLCVGLAKEIYEETNKERVAAGLPELEWSDELAEAADIRAGEIVDDAHFSHVRPDGTKCYALSDRIHGENIGKGPHASGAEFVQHWMDSEGHKWNILCDKYTMMGVGTRCTERGDAAVQVFGY